MTFNKFLTWWIIVTVVFAILALLCTSMAPARTLWPFGLAFLYVGVLILLLGGAVLKAGNKKE